MSLEYNSLKKTYVMSHLITGYCYKTLNIKSEEKAYY